MSASAPDVANENGGIWWSGVTNTTTMDTTGIGSYIATNGLDNCNGQRNIIT